MLSGTFDSMIAASSHHTTLHFLEELSSNLIAFVDRLTLPALKSLHFTGQRDDHPNDSDTLRRFFERSGCNISSVTFPIGATATREETAACLRALPASVTSACLTWNAGGSLEPHFDLLCADDVLPRMTSITLEGGFGGNWQDYERVLYVLEFRRRRITAPTVKLESAKITLRRGVLDPERLLGTQTLAELHALRRDGLELEVVMTGRSMIKNYVVFPEN